MASGAPPIPSPPPQAGIPPGSVAATTTAAAIPSATIPAVGAASEINKMRIVHVTKRLAMHFQSGFQSDQHEFFQLCFALARGIDYAVSHKDIAPNVHDLPTIIKKVYQHRDDAFLKAAIMVLLISVKNACKNRWFQAEDSDELLMMANEMSSSFCVCDTVTPESNNVLQVIFKIMPRYYPRIKFSRLIASFEVKAGYEILLADIYIPRNITPEERIRLFVAQSDDITSSTCIISPPLVNFLFNGKGVERRTNVSLDNGPQFPTDITKMLKYGLNLFQAVGSFNGNYIIAIAVMKASNSSSVPVLQDYIQPIAAASISGWINETTSIPSPMRMHARLIIENLSCY